MALETRKGQARMQPKSLNNKTQDTQNWENVTIGLCNS